MDLMNISLVGILSMLAMGGSLPDDTKTQQQVAQVSTYILPNIAGQWQLQLDKPDPMQASCQERYNFGRDQQFIGSSGQEFTYGKYLYSATGDGLPALAIQTQYDNNETDCSGNRVDQTGDILVAYVKQQGEQMQWCKDSEGKQCDMTLSRVLP